MMSNSYLLNLFPPQARNVSDMKICGFQEGGICMYLKVRCNLKPEQVLNDASM
jgi:hypothetical protein